MNPCAGNWKCLCKQLGADAQSMTWGDVRDNIVQTGKGKSNMLVSLFFRIGSHKGEANMQRRYHRKCWMQLISCPLNLVAYGLCHIMKEVTLSSSLLKVLLCGPRVALMQHHGEVFKNRGQSAEINSLVNMINLQLFFKKKLNIPPDVEAQQLTDAAYKVPPAKLDTAALKARKYANINNFPALIMCYFDKQTQAIIQKLLPALLTIFNISETEFQARGGPHEHGYLQFRNQPTLYDYGVSHESNIATANKKNTNLL